MSIITHSEQQEWIYNQIIEFKKQIDLCIQADQRKVLSFLLPVFFRLIFTQKEKTLEFFDAFGLKIWVNIQQNKIIKKYEHTTLHIPIVADEGQPDIRLYCFEFFASTALSVKDKSYSIFQIILSYLYHGIAHFKPTEVVPNSIFPYIATIGEDLILDFMIKVYCCIEKPLDIHLNQALTMDLKATDRKRMPHLDLNFKINGKNGFKYLNSFMELPLYFKPDIGLRLRFDLQDINLSHNNFVCSIGHPNYRDALNVTRSGNRLLISYKNEVINCPLDEGYRHCDIQRFPDGFCQVYINDFLKASGHLGVPKLYSGKLVVGSDIKTAAKSEFGMRYFAIDEIVNNISYPAKASGAFLLNLLPEFIEPGLVKCDNSLAKK